MLKDSPLAATKLNEGQLGVIPSRAKAVLIKAIYGFEPAYSVVENLNRIGIRRSERSVMIWLKTIRAWLGFPRHYPCTSSVSYRALVARCMAKNGCPDASAIDAGWKPESFLAEDRKP